MFWLDRTLGPLRIRAWGLLVNFLMNGVALVGLALWLGNQSGPLLMLLGFAGTIACILVLAMPDRGSGSHSGSATDSPTEEVDL